MGQVYYFALIYQILCALYAVFSEFMKTELCFKLSGKILKSFVQNKSNVYWIAIVFLEVQSQVEVCSVFTKEE